VNPRAVAAVAGLAAFAVFAGCTPSSPRPGPSATGTPTAAATFRAGADGLGDAYYPKAGNGGYDVGNYALDLRYDPATDRLSGTAAITATATADLSRFNLDFTGLKAEKVTVDGAEAKAQQSGGELLVTPTKGLVKSSRFKVEVRYSGVPKAYVEKGLGKIGFLHTGDGAFAIGEPQVAASWFPVNDHPRDKATYAITIAAPDGLVALANGVLKGKSSSGGWTRWRWSESRPMASYLATVVIGKYRVHETTHDGKPVVIAVDTSLSEQVDSQLARTPAVVDFLESKFGPYPFDAIGGIVIDDKRIRFALENQTRPIYSWAFFQPGEDGTWVIVHELAHQWYGDSVSVNEWREIWLNEGFATYAEWLWSEERGQQSAQRAFDSYYAEAGNSELWTVPPGDPGVRKLFHSSVYNRGAMALHALRVTAGDDAFFKILKAWSAEKRDANATTAEFIALSEQITGKELDPLFRAWLYGKTRPPRPRR
jgi:aminopeptidase N